MANGALLAVCRKSNRATLLPTFVLLGAGAFISDPALAACGASTPNGNGGNDYVVSGVETTTCTIGANDTLTVQQAGSIVTAVGGALTHNGGAGSIINHGLLQASEFGARVFLNNGVLASFINTGTIENTVDASGIRNLGTITLFNNNGGLVSGISAAIRNSGTMTITNNGGVIRNIASNEGVRGDTNAITHIDNTNGLIESLDASAVDIGLGSINNTDGIIRADDDSAVELNRAITGPLINTRGLLTSEMTDVDRGTFHIDNDIANLTFAGGTIVNTLASTNDATAVGVDGDQTGTIIFDGVSIIADGTGLASGYAVYSLQYDASLAFTSTTSLRGRIFVGNGGSFNLTTSAAIVGDISMADGNDTLLVAGGSIDGDIDLGTGANTLTFQAPTFATQGTITTGLGGSTDLTVANSGTLTVAHAIDLGSGDVDVNAGSKLYVKGANVTATGQLTNAGTTQIGVGRTVAAGSFDGLAVGQMVFDTSGVANAMTTGLINVGTSAADLSQQSVSVNFTGGTLVNPTRSLIVTGTGTATLPAAAVTDNSFLYDFGLERDGVGLKDVYLRLTQATTIAAAATTGSNERAGEVILNELAGSGNTQIGQIQARLGNAATQQEFNEILEATLPTVDNGNQVAAVGMTGAMFDLADGQLAMVSTGGETGVSSGNALRGLHFWGQAFGGKADQGFREGVDGYDARVHGMALGVDTRNWRSDTVVGLSLGFADTRVGSDNANRTRTDVESYQLMAYGNHDLGSDSFLTGMALLGWNGNDQARFDVGGVPGLTARADYDSWVGGLRASYGRNFRYPGMTQGDSFQLTPQLFSEFVHFSRDGYSETGAGGANLTAGDASQTILNAGISLQAEWTYILEGGGKLKPDLHVSYKYDLIGDAADTTASFAAGGSTFAVDGVDPAKSAFSIGAGVKFFDVSGWDFTANYDYSFKSEYEAHSGFVRAAYEF